MIQKPTLDEFQVKLEKHIHGEFLLTRLSF